VTSWHGAQLQFEGRARRNSTLPVGFVCVNLRQMVVVCNTFPREIYARVHVA
jgi:hypothetical protein